MSWSCSTRRGYKESTQPVLAVVIDTTEGSSLFSVALPNQGTLMPTCLSNHMLAFCFLNFCPLAFLGTLTSFRVHLPWPGASGHSTWEVRCQALGVLDPLLDWQVRVSDFLTRSLGGWRFFPVASCHLK